ncbi:MAG: tetratricopeptide repeat protein [Nocardioidaceae bacterium]
MTVDDLSDASPLALPEGVVTFLFTDIEGSTKLLHRLGDEYSHVLATHHGLLRACFLEHEGYEVGTEGDAFFVSFSSARQAVAAAVDAQRALHAHRWPHGEPLRVRMGLHTGEPLVVDREYVGMDVHRAARISSAAHGGQVLVSARLAGLVAGRTPDGVTLLDLGEHQLKDLPGPERLLQLQIDGLPSSFPPLRSVRPPTNLPHQASALLGRQREIQDLRTMLLRTDRRLVTVTGPGGVGKTRLVAAVASRLADDFPQGAFFVDLSRVREGDQVLAEVARVLDVPVEDLESAPRALAGHIRDGRMLLVLDNFEQALDGAVAVAGLLEACPALQVVVTSRALLDLRDEQEFALGPMGLPTGGSLREVADAEAVQLFVERARMVRREFLLTEANAHAVAELCALLDGLPLAIELAASRTRVFPPQALLDRLDDRLRLLTGGSQDAPERHRTLRATIDWSYELLGDDERALFRDLAVFDGGGRFDSIEAVCAPDADVLDPLASLVNHSLVRQREDAEGEPRYVMLKTIQDYAAGLLEAVPEHRAELRARHARHYRDLVEQSTGESQDGPRRDLDRVEPELDNVRAALAFWLEDGQVAAADAAVDALRLAAGMASYWYPRGMAAEGERWLDRALSAAVAPPADVEARALRMLGVLTEQRREYDRAEISLRRALALYQQLGDRRGEARSLNSLGVLARSLGRSAEAEQHLSRAAAIREDLADSHGVNVTRNNLGVVYLDEGKWEQALALFRENLAVDEAADDVWGVATSALNLGVALLLGDEVDEAATVIRRAFQGFIEVADPDGVLESLEAAVGLAVVREEWVPAARLAAAAATARLSLDQPGAPADRVHLDGWLGRCREAMGADAYHAAWEQGAAMTYDQAVKYALDKVARG